MSYQDNDPYDPPVSRRRSASFGAPAPVVPPIRRSTTDLGQPDLSGRMGGYHSDTSESENGDDDEKAASQPLVDVGAPPRSGPYDPPMGDDGSPGQGMSWEDAADWKNQRVGRMSKGWEAPGTKHSGTAESLLAQIYDLTHAIDALNVDVSDISALRKKISKLDPREDPGQISIKADLDSLQHLTTDTGRAIVSIEQWLKGLQRATLDIRVKVKSGTTDFTYAEYAELKFNVASAKLDFADEMERIREGAFREMDRRQRVRTWMARHIRSREPEIEDESVYQLLKAAELGSANGAVNNDVISYAGLFALNNPFTELSEITKGVSFALDRDVVDSVTGKKQKKQKSAANKLLPPSRNANAPSGWFASRNAVFQNVMYQRKIQDARMDAAYGQARFEQMENSARRKKMIICLLLVLLIGLIMLVVLATMSIPDWVNTIADENALSDETIEPAISSPFSMWQGASDNAGVHLGTQSDDGMYTWTSSSESSIISSSSTSMSSEGTSSTMASQSDASIFSFLVDGVLSDSGSNSETSLPFGPMTLHHMPPDQQQQSTSPSPAFGPMTMGNGQATPPAFGPMTLGNGHAPAPSPTQPLTTVWWTPDPMPNGATSRPEQGYTTAIPVANGGMGIGMGGGRQAMTTASAYWKRWD